MKLRLAILVVLVALLAGTVFRRSGDEPSGAPRQLYEVSSQSADPSFIYANGTVQGRERDVALRFEIVGRLASVHVREGDLVRQGDVLARLDPATWDVDLAVAQARLAQAHAQRQLLLAGATPEVVEFAKAEARRAHAEMVNADARYERVRKLAQNSAATPQDLDNAAAQVGATRASYQAALAKVNEAAAAPRQEDLNVAEANIALEAERVRYAQAMLAKTRLLAPSDGLIVQRRGEVGELVGPDSERPVAVLSDISEIRVRCYVEELDATEVRPGSQAHVEFDGMPGQRLQGRVVQCSPYMAAKTLFSDRPDEWRDVKVREVLVQLDPSDEANRLLVGLPVDVYIERDAKAGPIGPFCPTRFRSPAPNVSNVD